MKMKIVVTKYVEIDLPDDRVAQVANEHLAALGPEIYAMLLCYALDDQIFKRGRITGEQVRLVDYAAQMTVSNLHLVETLENEIPEIQELDANKGESYDPGRMMEWSPDRLSLLSNKPIVRPTFMEAKTLCGPVVNVHGRHYRTHDLGVVSTITIMNQYGLIDENEWFVFSPKEINSGWIDFCEWVIDSNYKLIFEVPVVFLRKRENAGKRGTLEDLFLDRCEFDPEISETIGVKYYSLNKDEDDYGQKQNEKADAGNGARKIQ